MEKDYSELQSRIDSQTSQPYDLQTEIFELTDLKEDLESSLVLNKSILKQMISKQDALFQKINENEKLYGQLKIQQKERNDSQVKALLSEQIAEEAHRREFETITEFEEKIQELKYFANRKELFTQELRKKLVVLEEEIEQEKVFKKAHVVPPTTEVLSLHNQLQDTKTKIYQITKKLNQISQHTDVIVEKSDFLQIENDKIKTLFKNPLHRNQLKNKQQIKKMIKPQLRLLERSFDQFYRGHKEFSENESGGEGSSLEEIQFPAKFQRIFGENENSKAKIPQLNLSNVQREAKPDTNLMAQRIMIREEQIPKKQKTVHLTPSEQRLEMLLERLKKRYQDYQDYSTDLDTEMQNIKKQIKHFQKQNSQLAQALQNQNRKKGLGDNKEFIKKKMKSKLKRQNSNPLDYIDLLDQQQISQNEQNAIPIFNINFAKSARPVDWVFLPLCAVMLFSGLLKILLNELVSQSSIQQLTEEDIRANQVLSRTSRWKSYYKFVPQNAFKQRRALFCRKEDGIFAFKFEDLSNSPMAMMMDPTKMLSGMKKNMVMTISSIFTITWVSHFLSGFIAGKLPFALSERFRTMLQRGVELKALDVTYVSSLSWCFLMLFALGNVYKLILSEDKSDYSQMALLGMPPMMMAGGQQGRDNNKLFQSEKETFEMIQYSWGIDNADEKLLAKIKEANGS